MSCVQESAADDSGVPVIYFPSITRQEHLRCQNLVMEIVWVTHFPQFVRVLFANVEASKNPCCPVGQLQGHQTLRRQYGSDESQCYPAPGLCLGGSMWLPRRACQKVSVR